MTLYSTAEMIETVYQSRKSGVFGKYESFGMAGSTVTLADGRKFGVWSGADNQMHVLDHATAFEGVAATVLDAAHLALNP